MTVFDCRSDDPIPCLNPPDEDHPLCTVCQAEGLNERGFLDFFVAGIPAPQGSKKHVGNGVMVESSKKVKPWREDVRHTATVRAAGQVFAGSTAVDLHFVLPALKSDPHKWHHTTRPDIDKLVRSTLDALVSAGVLKDDSIIGQLAVTKRHAQGDQRPGVHIVLVDQSDIAAEHRARSIAAAAEARKAARRAS